MTSKNVFAGKWSYIMPDTKANSNGRIVLIKKLSFGPCEVYEWGIDNNGLPYEEYKWCDVIRLFTENELSEWVNAYYKILNWLTSRLSR